MNDNIKLIVNEDISLKEINLDDIESIFNSIVRDRNYLKEWLPFVSQTQEISNTLHFVADYLNSDRLNLTCTIWYQHQFAGIVGQKDTDLENKKLK